ncbi:hypothetical protein DFJ74DRAFT_652921 [Hyaloraphidium curvatum]|nr:hypothetical protein DFJ74DRAFT_652921 [Hyaloraphidium curvatum]
MFLRLLDRERAAIEAVGGHIFAAVSSEPLARVERARGEFAVGFPLESDPAHALAAHLRAKGVIDLVISPPPAVLSEKIRAEYEHGMVQPGIAFVARDGTVILAEAIVPASENRGGASHRPLPADLWKAAKEAIEAYRADPVGFKAAPLREVRRIEVLDKALSRL